MRTLRHGDSNIPRKTRKYITCGTSLTRNAPKNHAAFIPKGGKTKIANDDQPKDGRERGKPSTEKYSPRECGREDRLRR